MGNKNFSCRKQNDGAVIPGVVNITQREQMATWYRTGIPLTDVYEIMETLGQGHMGAVYKVRRKVESRGLHNSQTREKKSSASDMMDNSDHHSVGSFNSLSKRLKKKQRQKNEETLKKLEMDEVKDEVKKSPYPNSAIKLKPILKNPSKQYPIGEVSVNNSVAEIDDNEQSESVSGGVHDYLQNSLHPRFSGTDNASPDNSSDNESLPLEGTMSEDYRADVYTNSAEKSLGKRDKRWVPRRKIRFQRLYACKTIATEKIKGEQLNELLNEIYFMRKMDHPYIIRLYEVYQVNRNIWLVMDLCTGGNLTTRKLNEPGVTVVGEQILRGVSYLHRRGIKHRDIKLENILYEDSSAKSSIRLIDFGLSQTYDISAENGGGRGAAYCMSPEVAGNIAPYTEKSDVWSIGVIVWILLAGDYPFLKNEDDLKDDKKKAKLVNATIEFGITWRGRGISDFAKTFVRGCLRKDPQDRWSAIEALEYLQDQWIPELEAKCAKETEMESKRLEAKPITPTRKNAILKNKSKETTAVLENSHSSKIRKDHDIFDRDIMEDIIRFTKYGLLKKTALIALANTMDRKDVGRLSELFLMVDTDQTGTISPHELKRAIKELDIEDLNDELIENIFHGIDHDQSGQIHYAEFLAALAEGAGLVTEERINDAFDRIDSEGKGYISHRDLQHILGENYNAELANKMIEEGDFKKNGRVDYDEFLSLMLTEGDEFNEQTN